MTIITFHDSLPFVNATLTYRGQRITFSNVLIDTGSASTIFSTDKLLEIGLTYESQDQVFRIRGVGGSESVFTKKLDELSLGDISVHEFKIDVGAMDYSFDIEGIIGMDFLTEVGAEIDLGRSEVTGK